MSRVNQIDAAQLDDEIYKVLRNQVTEITKHQPVGKIDEWQPEIDAILKILIWSHSLRVGNATFGQELLNLHYGSLSRLRAWVYLVATVVPAYLQDKLADNRLTDTDAKSKLKPVVDTALNVAKFVSLVNALSFLHRGRQPCIVERLLDISSTPMRGQKPRTIGYSYMTRELLWHGLVELFTLGLPMINYHYLKELFKRVFYRRTPMARNVSQPRMSPTSKCAFCGETPIHPTHAGCEHLFCYYCLYGHFAALSALHCPKCDAELRDTDAQYYVH